MSRKSHVQTTLLPPEALETQLRIGVVGAADHVQVQVEVRDAGSGELLALWSQPHAPYAELAPVIERAAREAVDMTREIAGPF